jgi:hypothetical protein
MDIKDLDAQLEGVAKSMGFTELCGGYKEPTDLKPASAVIDKCFDSIQEKPNQYRRLYPSMVTGPSRDIAMASSDERKERADKWTLVPARLECLEKTSFEDIGEPLWVGHNPTPYDGFGFWEILPEESVEIPRWLVEFVNKNCSKFNWRSIEKSEETLARESGRGAGSVQKCGIGYSNMLIRESAKNTHRLKPA